MYTYTYTYTYIYIYIEVEGMSQKHPRSILSATGHTDVEKEEKY